MRTFAIVGIAVILRWCVSYHPHSGEGKPPMYGDYEAQRHWQEITKNLPIQRWYTNDSDNDLQYWGLDYPPLTAYHSFVLGHVAHKIDPKWVELYESRGYESQDHKYFMRLSVLAVDALLYIPALVYFVRKATVHEGTLARGETSNVFGLKKDDFILSTALLYPGIILVDHGHFQYNCVSLGLFISAVALILRNHTIMSSLLFVLALNYKQMELYHALPFFFYILGNNTPGKRKSLLSCFRSLICVSLTVTLTFIVIWAPFIQKWEVFKDALTRLFPLDRGVFEDKVSNFWCTVNIFYKIRNSLANVQLARLCLVATMLSVLPSCLNLYLKPHKERFVLSLINCALGFYLFSFQVHEKSILLVAIPVVMYFHRDPLPCFWFLMISTFSMLPLLIKDKLVLAYFSLSFFYAVAVCIMWAKELSNFTIKDKESVGKSKTKMHRDTQLSQRKFRVKQSGRSRFSDSEGWPHRLYDKIQNFIGKDFLSSKILMYLSLLKITSFCFSLIGVLLLSTASIALDPPDIYPDLFALLVSVYSCLHFILFFIYFNYKQIYGLQKHSGKSKSH